MGKASAAFSGNSRGHFNEQRLMRLVFLFGHVRLEDIAAAIWPHAKYGEQLAGRLANRLVKRGWLTRRVNTLRGSSFVLAKQGAGYLAAQGLSARDGHDICGVAGATFVHRSLATRFLISRLQDGDVAGEYAIGKNWAPMRPDEFRQRFFKMPDGLVLARQPDHDSNVRCVDWVEVESSSKSMAELKKVIGIASRTGQAIGRNGAYLRRLVIVYERNSGHEARILKAFSELFNGVAASEVGIVGRDIELVSVELKWPLQWVGFESRTIAQHLVI